MLCRSMSLLPVITLAVAVHCPAATARGPRRLADEPLAIMYARDINEQSVAQYVAGLSTRLGVGKTMSWQLGTQLEKTTVSKVPHPVTGQVIYLVQGLVPSLEMISFRSAVDEQEAMALIESQQRMMGDQATIEEGVDGYCKLVRAWEYESELQPEQEVEEYNREGPGYSQKLEVIERDGKRFQKQSGRYTKQFRYYDRFLYSGQSEEFVGARLPASQDIFNSLDDDTDAGLKVYADRVPQGIRTMSWNMLSATVGTQLQRQDNEDEKSWRMRHSAGNWALQYLRSLLFDVASVEGAGHLASDRQPVRGQIVVRPRRNSGFIEQLRDLKAAQSLFAPLLRDDAGASLHVCVSLPPEGQETLAAVADWIIASQNTSPQVRAAVTDIFTILHDIAGGDTLELMVRLVHAPSSGSVILAAVQVGDREDLLPNLESGLQSTLGREFDCDIQMAQRYGRPIVRVQLPVDADDPVRLPDLWIAHRDGCLWLAAGGETAHEMIRMAAERCGESGRAIRARLVTAKLDVDHWMSWPEDDPTGLATLPRRIDSGEAASLMSGWTPFGRGQQIESTPLLERVLALPGRREAWLTLDADRSGLTIQAEVGAPLVDWFFARQMDTQEKSMQRMKRQAEDATRKAAAAKQREAEANE